MNKFLLHPAVQVVLYLVTFMAALFATWSVIDGLVPSGMTVRLMLQEILEAVYCVLLVVGFSVYWQKRKFSETGIVKCGVVLETLLGFLFGFVVSGGAILGMFVVGGYHPLMINTHASLWYPLVLFFFAAVVEEVIFRVFIFQTCEKRWGTVAGIVISSVIFGLAHMINEVNNASFAEQLTGCTFLIFEAGFLLNAVFLINRRIWLPLGLHWAWNFFEGPVFGTIVSGQNFGPSVIVANISGPFLISGGPFGPEGSLAGLLVGIACGAAATWYSIRYGAWKIDHER